MEPAEILFDAMRTGISCPRRAEHGREQFRAIQKHSGGERDGAGVQRILAGIFSRRVKKCEWKNCEWRGS